TGETVRSRTRALFGAIAVGAVLPLLRDIRGLAVIGGSARLCDCLRRISAGGARYAASDAGLVLDHSLLLVAAGVFVGLRTTVWVPAGGGGTGLVPRPGEVSGTVR